MEGIYEKKYLKPSINVEFFEASEYVSTCVKSDVVGKGTLWGESGQQEGLQIGSKNEDIYLGNNICMETHKFNQGLPSYKKGYWKPYFKEEIDVYYWGEYHGRYWKYHVVTNKGDFSNSTTNAS